MVILQLNSVYGFGSTGRIVKDLKDVINSYSPDFKCNIIYGRGKLINEDFVWKIGSALDCGIHLLSARLTDKAGFYSKSYTRKIIKKIQECKPDIIHLHNIHGYWVNIEILFNFLRDYGKPIVWTLHDCWPFTGHCAYYDAINCTRWLEVCNQCPQIYEYPKSLFRDNSLNNFYLKQAIFRGIKNLHIVTPSQWLQNEVSKSFLKDYPCYTIANGIDLNRFTMNYSHNIRVLNHKKIKILGVANIWEKRKGLYDFIELAKFLDLNSYEILVVGVNTKQKLMLDKYGITAIERTDSIEELVTLYQQADVFFNPTYEDNFPTTNIEALACGTPVLTYKTGGSPESLNPQCGIIIDKGDIIAAIEHLKKWKLYNFDSKLCGIQAGKYDKYDKFIEYCELYRDILCMGCN